jgi:hypothetical protein
MAPDAAGNVHAVEVESKNGMIQMHEAPAGTPLSEPGSSVTGNSMVTGSPGEQVPSTISVGRDGRLNGAADFKEHKDHTGAGYKGGPVFQKVTLGGPQ